ncbi:MAG TPA: hypothetical protein H9704_04940 [Candidatus Enterocloster excrementipullorum]|uniref:Stage II sporulation protein M n=1 Tax=Candidatus Enterocloster excrementipullorum TaxID=2838559 RepID=A0A9D2SHK0_9FIRM|nr:hypothetical protein [Candidatus Enterocloster excrementipullorum]
MRLRGFKGFTYGDWLLLCFCLGLGAGMALALMFGDYGVQEGMLWAGAAGELGREAKRRAFLELLRQRAAGCMAGWVAGLTVCSKFLFGLLTFHGGMSMAAVLTGFTVRRGLLGFPLFLGALLPQGILYGAAWGIMAGWAGQREKRVHFFPALFLLGITAVGAFLEMWILLLRSR